MQIVPLTFREGHLFANLNGHDWLLDTGAPSSFGSIPSLAIENRIFRIPESYMGLTGAKLSEFVGKSTVGIIGADVLNEFDILLDVPQGQVSFSVGPIELAGAAIRTDQFMGIPIIEANIGGVCRRMFFDTGAQVSYFQDASLTTFPSAGRITDFYPGFGQFQTETYLVDMVLGGASYAVRCGSLPSILGMTLVMAKVDGIIGNEILREHVVGFFPRRQQLVLT